MRNRTVLLKVVAGEWPTSENVAVDCALSWTCLEVELRWSGKC